MCRTSHSPSPGLPRPANLLFPLVLLILAAAAPTAEAVYLDSSSPHSFRQVVRAGGEELVLFFVEPPGPPYVTELWRTDGTEAGTYLLDVCPECRLTGYQGGRGGVFIDAQTEEAGRTFLWTDGTLGRTRRMPAVTTVAHGWTNHHYSPTLDRLLIVSSRPDGSEELWSWDGSASPPVRLLAPEGNGYRNVLEYADTQTDAYFLTTNPDQHYQVWVTDGTAAGTRSLGGPSGPVLKTPMVATGDGVAWLSMASTCTVEAWAATPQQAAHPVTTLDATICQFGSYDFYTSAAGSAFFLLFSEEHEIEAWATDGTAAGTARLTDFNNQFPFTNEDVGVELGGELYFLARDDQGVAGLWRTDGTPAGTVRVRDACDSCQYTERLSVHEGELYWESFPESSTGSELWTSDGTAGGTGRRATVALPRSHALMPAGAQWFVFASRAEGARVPPYPDDELWALQPEAGAFTRIARFPRFERGERYALEHATLGDRLAFPADDGFHGTEPWVSDGTAAGTRMLRDIAATGTGSRPPAAPIFRQPLAQQGQVFLSWAFGDAQVTTGSFEIEARWPGQGWLLVDEMDSTYESTSITGLLPDTPYTFRIREINAAGASPWSEEVSVRTWDGTQHDFTCTPADDRLCFENGRFGVKVTWWNQHHQGPTPRIGDGRRVGVAGDAGAGRTGFFWFFKPDNVELVLKMLDGSSINQYEWLFYGALSDVEYWVTVEDYWAHHQSRTYHNPPGEICGLADPTAFHVDGASSAGLRAAALPTAPPLVRDASHPASPCVEDASTLCLLDGRFAVTVEWYDHHNDRTGVGGAVPYADRSGFFWFFRQDNVELAVKILDGTLANGHFWVFYGALTDVGYTLTVSDTASGHAVETYVNEPGNVCGGADTAAF